jgi:hypothetical protein
LTQNCGGAVAVNLVANNATALASTLHAQGVANGVMQAGGMGLMVNPMTNQPINGITMSGYTQAGYPPIGYAPYGYAPGYPRYAPGMIDAGQEDMLDEEEEKAFMQQQETRSTLNAPPKFHPVPYEPTMQRREGMPSTPQNQRATATAPKVAMMEQPERTEKELEAALDRAYLEGVSAAMNEVERKMEEKRQAAATAKLQERIMRQSEYVQQQLDEQERMQMIAMQRAQQERQLRQQQSAAVPTLPSPAQSVAQSAPVVRGNTTNNTNTNALQLAGNLKASVTNGVNGLLGANSNANHGNSNQREQVPTLPKPQPQNTAQQSAPKAKTELAYAESDVPVKPPTLPAAPKYGLLPDDEADSLILQARFSDDGTAIRP